MPSLAFQALRAEYDLKKAPLFKSRFQIVTGQGGEDADGVPGFWLQVRVGRVAHAQTLCS